MRHIAVPFRTVAVVVASVSALAAGPRDTLVVSNAWLAAHLADPDLVVLHVGDSNVKAEFERAHIPGAQFVDFGELAKPMDHSAMKPGELMLEMPAPEQLRKQLVSLGISDRSRIVVYYANDYFSPTTRVIQTLNYAGLGAQTMMLENSMRKWVREGRPTADTSSPAKPGSLSPLKIQPVVVDAAFVRAHIGTPGYVIVDARDGVREHASLVLDDDGALVDELGGEQSESGRRFSNTKRLARHLRGITRARFFLQIFFARA